jgi:biopolymer transport protein ExbD
MSRHHQTKRKLEGVKLNLAAMLDMAFQLLAFFILTFKPAPSEGQVNLRLPPAQPVAVTKTGTPGGDYSKPADFNDLKSLVISINSHADGSLAHANFLDLKLTSLPTIEKRLHTELAKQGSIFDQVKLQIDSRLKYEQLMLVVDICSQAKLPNGQRLTKLSFAELPVR